MILPGNRLYNGDDRSKKMLLPWLLYKYIYTYMYRIEMENIT